MPETPWEMSSLCRYYPSSQLDSERLHREGRPKGQAGPPARLPPLARQLDLLDVLCWGGEYPRGQAAGEGWYV